MSDYIIDVIDAVQDFNREAVTNKQITAPCLAEYPPTTDTARTPTMLTYTEAVRFDRLDSSEMSIDLVIRCLHLPVGQGQFSSNMVDIHQTMSALLTRYTTASSYEQVGRRVLLKNPVDVTISSEFDMTGYQLIEYPAESGFWYHGFELRFTVDTQASGDNC